MGQKEAKSFEALLKSFLGYLQGTGKSAHTLQSYRLDLLAFQRFFQAQGGGQVLSSTTLQTLDLTHYQEYLQTQGLRANTRRRRLFTVVHWLHYAVRRRQLPQELNRLLPVPPKVERVPTTLSIQELLERIQALPSVDSDLLACRNRLILWLLAETGCLVSEVGSLRVKDFILPPKKQRLVLEEAVFSIHFRPTKEGKKPRTLVISKTLAEAVLHFVTQQALPEEAFVFVGFHAVTGLKPPLSSRAVELLVRAYAEKLGHPPLVPKVFRSSLILFWLQQGVPRKEIQTRLGLQTPSVFRVFEPLLQAASSKKA